MAHQRPVLQSVALVASLLTLFACGMPGTTGDAGLSPASDALHFRATVEGQPWDGSLPDSEVKLPDEQPGTLLLAGRDPSSGYLVLMALEGIDGSGRYKLDPRSHAEERGCGAAMGTARQSERCAGMYFADGEVEITELDGQFIAGNFSWRASLDGECDDATHDDSDLVVEDGSFRFRWPEGGPPAGLVALR